MKLSPEQFAEKLAQVEPSIALIYADASARLPKPYDCALACQFVVFALCKKNGWDPRDFLAHMTEDFPEGLLQ